MEVLAANPRAERARTEWLIRLRWMAVLGVLAVLLAAGPILGLLREAWPILGLALALATWNTVLNWRSAHHLPTQSAGSQVVLDLLVLCAMLAFSGGLRNPFAVFVVVQALLGGILLPRREALRIGALGILLTILLGVLERLEALPPFEGVYRIPVVSAMPVWAVALALVITLSVALQFTVTIMDDLRASARRATLYHERAETERVKLMDVVRSVGASVVLLDEERRVDWINEQARRLFGERRQGESFALHGAPGWPPIPELEEGRILTREWRGTDQRGRERIHHITASPVFAASGDLEQVVMVLTDITDRRAAELQLQRTEKLSALGRLAAGVAHEINTPLGSVRILVSESLAGLRRDQPLDEALREELLADLSLAVAETDRIAGLVRRLLELGHPGSEARREVDLNELARAAVRLAAMRDRETEKRIHFDLAEDLPQVRTEPDRVRQVLLNLIDNALDATRNGKPVLLSSRRVSDRVQLTIRDSGTGIEASDLSRVFDPFFTTKEVGEGTGLGLYVSYEIVRNLGGEIAVESRVDEGTTVRVSLPLCPVSLPELEPR